MPEYELLIKNGTIVEGTRIPAFKGDIGINGGRITAMGNLTGSATRVIDATGLIVAPDAGDAYEKLRTAVLRAEPAACPGLGILRRRGLAAWLRALGQEPHAEAACRDHPPAPSAAYDSSPAASDITRLIAGIIVALAMESVHA